MKKNTQILFNQVSKTGENHSTQTEERLSKETGNNQMRTFSSADLWNIHRQKKNFVIR